MSYFLENWKVVIISLIGATTFWFFNALNKSYDTTINYPVEFTFSQDSNVVMQPLPASIRINVSSGGWNLLRKTSWFNVPPIEIPLEQPDKIKYIDRGKLFPLVVNQMSELKVNHIVSDSLFLFIESKKTKNVLLRLDSTKIPLSPKHRITSPISIKPDSILLIGPSSFIDSLQSEYSLVLNMQNIDDPVNQNIHVNLPNNLIESEPKEINVSFDVEQFVEEQITVPVELAGFPRDSSRYLETGEVIINYLVADSKKRSFDPSEFVVLVDLSTIDRKDSTIMPILLFHPPEIVDVTVLPDQLKVVYE
ncbi:MAG: hypothetical protein RLQ12_00295 [Cyclobacteriaceae bacterium]